MSDVVYITCPDCKGKGQLLFPKQGPNGYMEAWDECELCQGLGDFEEQDYLAMKLAGEV